ncbi:MAG: carboxylating nicotinate-nucleotide diphosphorylase, partial [Bacillota bacterium]|nr:carboxylating nicotinate-nucleotide diphosphorylase [Bacillota bacterium]
MLDMHAVDKIVRIALAEDIGRGDITTLSTVSIDKHASGCFISKEDGIICGLPVVKRVFEMMDRAISLECHVDDGDAVEKGAVIAEVSGPARAVLTGERVALNFLQHMSGIATRTREAVEAVKGTKAIITDTRKTTPGLRALEKYAVKTGGGSNHRFSLCDGVLIKNNHIRAAGSITDAVKAARRRAPRSMKIEVEVEDFTQLEEALSCGADIIMLDNMGLPEMAKAVKRVGGRALVEASGNMGDKDLAAVARTGVD